MLSLTWAATRGPNKIESRAGRRDAAAHQDLLERGSREPFIEIEGSGRRACCAGIGIDGLSVHVSKHVRKHRATQYNLAVRQTSSQSHGVIVQYDVSQPRQNDL